VKNRNFLPLVWPAEARLAEVLENEGDDELAEIARPAGSSKRLKPWKSTFVEGGRLAVNGVRAGLCR
jgi:hypothetical protein